MIRLDKLRELALALKGTPDTWATSNRIAFEMEANPATIISLITALETATGPLRRIATGDAVQASTMHAIAVQALEAIEKELG